MKLVRKIKFKRAQEISIFKRISALLLKHKNKDCKNPKKLSFYSDNSKLHFYLVIEYINLINEKINYDKIFPDTPIGSNAIIDFNNLVEEQEKLKLYIQNSQKKGPVYFKSLGILNEVVGCYLVATTHKHLKKVRNFDFKNKNHDEFVCVKFDLKNLPFEFEKICINYGKNKFNFLEKEKEDFQNFLNLSNEEQDNIIDGLLNAIQNPYIDFEKDFEIPQSDSTSATTIQYAAENNIKTIQNIEFLMCMLGSAEETENYELCVKIRDRIYELKSTK